MATRATATSANARAAPSALKARTTRATVAGAAVWRWPVASTMRVMAAKKAATRRASRSPSAPTRSSITAAAAMVRSRSYSTAPNERFSSAASSVGSDRVKVEAHESVWTVSWDCCQ